MMTYGYFYVLLTNIYLKSVHHGDHGLRDSGGHHVLGARRGDAGFQPLYGRHLQGDPPQNAADRQRILVSRLSCVVIGVFIFFSDTSDSIMTLDFDTMKIATPTGINMRCFN